MPQPSTPQVLPLQPSVPWYRMTVPINDTPYLFDVKWNARDQAWYFDLYEVDETPIAFGIKIVLGISLGRRVQHPLMQHGAFVARDLSNQWIDAGFDDMGTRVQLRYFTVYDIIAVARGLNGFGS